MIVVVSLILLAVIIYTYKKLLKVIKLQSSDIVRIKCAYCDLYEDIVKSVPIIEDLKLRDFYKVQENANVINVYGFCKNTPVLVKSFVSSESDDTEYLLGLADELLDKLNQKP
jgi:hypothetical protein